MLDGYLRTTALHLERHIHGARRKVAKPRDSGIVERPEIEAATGIRLTSDVKDAGGIDAERIPADEVSIAPEVELHADARSQQLRGIGRGAEGADDDREIRAETLLAARDQQDEARESGDSSHRVLAVVGRYWRRHRRTGPHSAGGSLMPSHQLRGRQSNS